MLRLNINYVGIAVQGKDEIDLSDGANYYLVLCTGKLYQRIDTRLVRVYVNPFLFLDLSNPLQPYIVRDNCVAKVDYTDTLVSCDLKAFLFRSGKSWSLCPFNPNSVVDHNIDVLVTGSGELLTSNPFIRYGSLIEVQAPLVGKTSNGKIKIFWDKLGLNETRTFTYYDVSTFALTRIHLRKVDVSTNLFALYFNESPTNRLYVDLTNPVNQLITTALHQYKVEDDGRLYVPSLSGLPNTYFDIVNGHIVVTLSNGKVRLRPSRGESGTVLGSENPKYNADLIESPETQEFIYSTTLGKTLYGVVLLQ